MLKTQQLDLFSVQVAPAWGCQLGPWHYWTFDTVTGHYVAACNPRIRTKRLFISQEGKPGKCCSECEKKAP